MAGYYIQARIIGLFHTFVKGECKNSERVNLQSLRVYLLLAGWYTTLLVDPFNVIDIAGKYLAIKH
jgi:hypothetical protein